MIVIGGGFGLKQYLNQQIQIKGKESKTQRRKQQKLNKDYATYYCYFAIFILILFGNAPLATCVFLTLLIVIAHGLLRERNFKSKATHFLDVYRDFGPISSFAEWISDFVDDNTPK